MGAHEWTPALYLLAVLVHGVWCQLPTIVMYPINATCVETAPPYFDCTLDRDLTVGNKLEWHKLDGLPPTFLGDQDSVPNPSKYSISGRYRLHIQDAQFADEGQYQCTLDTGAVEVASAYLIVSDPPKGASLFWGEERGHAILGHNQLTCHSERSRPLATFRWFRYDWLNDARSDLSHLASYQQSAIDGNGYGEAESILDLDLGSNDEEDRLRCLVDVPGGEGYHSIETTISFSGVAPRDAVLWLLVAATITGLSIST